MFFGLGLNFGMGQRENNPLNPNGGIIQGLNNFLNQNFMNPFTNNRQHPNNPNRSRQRANEHEEN